MQDLYGGRSLRRAFFKGPRKTVTGRFFIPGGSPASCVTKKIDLLPQLQWWGRKQNQCTRQTADATLRICLDTKFYLSKYMSRDIGSISR